jgi:hypothetical protein
MGKFQKIKIMLHLIIWLLQHVEIHGKRCSPWAPELVVLTLSLLKYMTTSIFVFGMTPRCCKVSAMYFMLGESPNEGPNDHIWLHNCQANLCMFLRFSNFLSEGEREIMASTQTLKSVSFWSSNDQIGSIGGWSFGANLTLTF